MSRKKQETRVVETEEQRTIASWNLHTEKSFSLLSAPPASRNLVSGMAVKIGNLKNCVVRETKSGGKFGLVDYVSVGRSGESRSVGIWGWVDCIPMSTDESREPLFAETRKNQISYTTTTVGGLLHFIYHWGIDFNAGYQRDYVWTDEDKARLIESVFAGNDIGKFIFVESDIRIALEVLDGKQRLSTLRDFYESRLEYKGKFWHELTIQDRWEFENVHAQYATVPLSDMKDKLRLFLKVNAAGVPQTEEHLAKVRALLEE